MHIAIVGPIATENISGYLSTPHEHLPRGYPGAPLLGSLIGRLLELGHTVSAFTLSSDMPISASSAVQAVGENFSIHYSPMRQHAWRPNSFHPGKILDLYRYERHSLKNAILASKPDVVHAHWVYEFASAAIATQLPHVVTCHDSPFGMAKIYSRSKPTISAYRWIRAFMARKILGEAKQVTTVSPYLKDEVQKITRCEIDVVPNPIDAITRQLAKPKQIRATPRIAMVCNGWDSRKNPKPGLMAFHQLFKEVPDATLHLYGNGFGPNQAAEQWCKSNAIHGGMFFHGAMPHKQLLNELSGHDLLLHTSIEESFGMVIAEAMALGVPVVAGQSSGAVPWVTGPDAELCDVTDPSAIHSALLAAIAPNTYAQRSTSGIDAISRRFSLETVTNQYLQQYQRSVAACARIAPAN